MKVKIIGAWQLEFTPENANEERILAGAFLARHVHFVCKALHKPPRARRKQLLLTPSVIRWMEPK